MIRTVNLYRITLHNSIRDYKWCNKILHLILWISQKCNIPIKFKFSLESYLFLNDSEKLKQLEEDEKNIEKKMTGDITPKELEKVYYELEKIINRKTEIQDNCKNTS